MTNYEINTMIEWCRTKLANEKKDPYGLSGKRLEGYEKAMKAVMSYLHNEKVKNNDQL
jgi:hypothetical protein